MHPFRNKEKGQTGESKYGENYLFINKDYLASMRNTFPRFLRMHTFHQYNLIYIYIYGHKYEHVSPYQV